MEVAAVVVAIVDNNDEHKKRGAPWEYDEGFKSYQDAFYRVWVLY